MKTTTPNASRRTPSVTMSLLRLLLAASLALVTTTLHAAQFSATAVHTVNGENHITEQIYVSGDLVRIESSVGKKGKVLILRPDVEAMLILDTAKATYREMPLIPGAHWASMHLALMQRLTKQGEATISGQRCDRMEAPGGIATIWLSPKLGFPVRTSMSGKTIELHHIVEQDMDRGLFAPPPGYGLEFSMFAMQGGEPRIRPTVPSVGQKPQPRPESPPAPRKDESRNRRPVPGPLPAPDDPLPAPGLRVRTIPADGGRLEEPEQSLVVRFSRPTFSSHVAFSLLPDPGELVIRWNDHATQATIDPVNPLDSQKSYTLTVSVAGEPDVGVNFTVRALDGALRLDRDLQRGVIDINAASRHRLNQLFNPDSVPGRYRTTKRGSSGTWTMLQVATAFDRLDAQTQMAMAPYFLRPTNPDSAYYDLFHDSGNAASRQAPVRLVPRAWASTDDTVRAEYRTGTGYTVNVWGDKAMERTVRKARDLIARYRIYERFERLLGRKTLDYGDNSLNIYIFPRLRRSEDTSGGAATASEPMGICYKDRFVDQLTTPLNKRAATILISARQCRTERTLGATLAHEMFHAFQFAFTLKAHKWLFEGTAVWSENFIEPAWNTEQGYLDDAFNPQMKALKALTDTSSDITPYAMYLFPMYMTNINPGYDDIIRRIWEASTGNSDSVQVVRSELGDFDAHWKTYALATLDEAPKQGQFPDVGNRHGDGPLQLSERHRLKAFTIDKQGFGGAAFGLTHLGASYIKAVNEQRGQDAPAVSFDLRRFQGNSKITVQAIVQYRNGRKEYEDWSDMSERIFCLSREEQNFEAVYIVVACADVKPREDIAETIEVVPALDNDCYRGSVTMTWRLTGGKSMQRRMGSHLQSSEHSDATWSRTATVRMDIKPMREDIPSQLSAALEQMEAMLPEVKKEHIEEGRRTAKAAVRAPVKSRDPHTGCVVHKYRVTACRVVSASGRRRVKSEGVENDAQGLIKSCSTTYSENEKPQGLGEETQELLDNGNLQVDVFIDPDSGKIKWVRPNAVSVDLNIVRKSIHPCNKRYQNRDTGTYYYKDEDFSWSDTKESDITLTFSSDSKDREGQPMDPVWKARLGGAASASGRGRKERPLDHEWNEAADRGEIKGREIEEFSWSIHLEPVKNEK